MSRYYTLEFEEACSLILSHCSKKPSKWCAFTCRDELGMLCITYMLEQAGFDVQYESGTKFKCKVE